nr:hypothetical protein [Prevotella sp.]
MRYENAWQVQDEITSVVNALGWSIWDLRYNRNADVFRLEIGKHLYDEEQERLVSQFPLSADYEGEGIHGSTFTLYA